MFKTKSHQDMPRSISDKYADVYCDVMVTNNYELFSYIDGNRPIRATHLKNIRDSIASKQIPVPIVVNEEYKICDGQNRFEACKMLKKPVYYVVVEGLRLEDVQRLNANTHTWDTQDFLDSYCELGYEHYLRYRTYKNRYKFGHTECMVILGGYKNEGKRLHQNFREGKFTVKDYSKAIEVSDKIVKTAKYYSGYKRKGFIRAMLRLFKNPEYNHNEFIDKLSKQSEKMTHQADVESYLKLIERLYNHRRLQGNKVRLFTY
jgi:disulfide oxidoreductase YuzD